MSALRLRLVSTKVLGYPPERITIYITGFPNNKVSVSTHMTSHPHNTSPIHYTMWQRVISTYNVSESNIIL